MGEKKPSQSKSSARVYYQTGLFTKIKGVHRVRIQSPSSDEIETLLRRWIKTEGTIKQIAQFACDNVRTDLMSDPLPDQPMSGEEVLRILQENGLPPMSAEAALHLLRNRENGLPPPGNPRLPRPMRQRCHC